MCGTRAAPSAAIASRAARRVSSASAGGSGTAVPAGRQRSIRSHSRCPPTRAPDADLPAHPHEVEHPRGVALVRPARRSPRLDRQVLDVARRQRAVGAQAVEDVRAERRVHLPPLHRARVARVAAHLPRVQRQVLGQDQRRLVRPELEQRTVAVDEPLEHGDVERPEPAEHDEQVRARHDARRVELQAAQRAADGGDRRGVGAPARARPGEPLVGQREAADGDGGHAQHERAR